MALSSLKVQAQSQDYEEVSYEDLIQRLSKKKTKVMNEQVGASVLDDIMIHAGIGLTTSALNYFDGKGTGEKHANGFQLSFGIDLFSPNWASGNVGAKSWWFDRSKKEIDSYTVKSFREFN